MSQIRVDPGELAQAAQKFGDLAARLSQLAAETIQAAESAPSYEGQFAPQVQSMGQDAQSRLSQQATRLRTLGEELAATASAFESADQQSIQGFEQLVLQFRSLLDGLGQLLPGGLGATIAAGQPLLGLQPVPPPPEPPTDEDAEKDWIDRFFDQIKQPEFWWDLLTQNRATAWMQRFKTAIPVTLVLPMLKGFGMDDVAGPLIRTFDGSFWVRSFGRLIGDSAAPPLLFVGWGLSAAPELVRNVRSGAPWNEFAADLAIDSGVFFGSELAGLGGFAAGSFIGGPQVGVPAKLGADVLAGAWLEWQVERHDWRGWLTTEIGEAPAGVSLLFAAAMGGGPGVEIPPIPTPPGLFSPTGTPVPGMQVMAPVTPIAPTGTSTPIPPQLPEPIKIVVTPLPPDNDQ